MEEIKQLIEDNKRKINAIDITLKGVANHYEGVRLSTKGNCYRTFVSELEKIRHKANDF